MKAVLFSFFTFLIAPTFFAHASDDTSDRNKGTPSRRGHHYEKTIEKDKLKLRKRELDWNRPGSKRVEDGEDDAPEQRPTDIGPIVVQQTHDAGPTLDRTDDQPVVKVQRRGLRGWVADQWQKHPKRLIAVGITGSLFLMWCFTRVYRAYLGTPMTPEEQQASQQQDQTVVSTVTNTVTDMASRFGSFLSDAMSDPMIDKQKFQQQN
jgi:hypothetical protein